MDYHWRNALNDAIAGNRRDAHNRYLQLATLDRDGYPANRTVVFRGFLDDDVLTMVTDARSGKVAQLQRCPAAEACWYFSRSREQFRIRGELALVDARSPLAGARRQAWARLSEAAKEQFYWPTPGATLGVGSAPDIGDDGLPACFLLLTLTPLRVDHLRLAGSPQSRVLSRREDTGWQARHVNP